jgi:hypothetical protein
MSFHIKPVTIYIFIAFALLAYACNTDKICNENRSTYLKIGIYGIQKVDNKVNVGLLDSIKVTIFGIGRPDSLIYNEATTSEIILPLSQLKDTSVFDIKIIHERTKEDYKLDNYTLIYKRSKVFINYDCGFRTDFVIDTIIPALNAFDSLYFNTRVVTDANEEHIKIFYRLQDVVTPVEP